MHQGHSCEDYKTPIDRIVQGHAGFTRVNWFTRAFNSNTCRRWIKRCYNLDNALSYLSTQIQLSSARSMRRVNTSDIWQRPGNKVLCFMGSPLRGQIDKLSFRRLVCGDWRTPAKNYNAFIVFLAPWFWLGAPWHQIVPQSMDWTLLRRDYRRRHPSRNLKKRFTGTFDAFSNV